MKTKKRRTTDPVDKIFDKRPNVYAFLVGRNVDSDIADACQEFVTLAWLDTAIYYRNCIYKDAAKITEEAVNKIEDLSTKFCHQMNDLHEKMDN